MGVAGKGGGRSREAREEAATEDGGRKNTQGMRKSGAESSSGQESDYVRRSPSRTRTENEVSLAVRRSVVTCSDQFCWSGFGKWERGS